MLTTTSDANLDLELDKGTGFWRAVARSDTPLGSERIDLYAANHIPDGSYDVVVVNNAPTPAPFDVTVTMRALARAE